MPSITLTDGCKIHVRALGRGPTVLLLHGFGLDGRQWLPLARIWQHKYRFIIPDLRGHGKSTLGTYDEAHPIERLAQDVCEIREQFQLGDELKIAGYSMGAMVGMAHLCSPERPRVAHYLHIEMGPRFAHSPDWSFGFHKGVTADALHLVDTHKQQGWSHESRWLYERLLLRLMWEAFPHGFLRMFAKHLPLAAAQLSKAHPDLSIKLYGHLVTEGFDFRSAIQSLHVPATIAYGAQSRYFHEGSSLWMHRNWHGSELVRFDRSGHGLMVSEPHRFARLFAKFLGEAPSLAVPQAEPA